MKSKENDWITTLNGNKKNALGDREVDNDQHQAWDMPPIPMNFRLSLYAHGEKRAVDSMASKPNENDLRTLEEHAAAMAEEAARNAFDPEKNLADKLAFEEYETNLVRRDDLRQKLSEASRQLHARSYELAELGNLDKEPSAISLATKVLLGLLIGATIVLTLHDFVFDFDDEIANWLVSSTAAFFLGLAVVWIETQNMD